MKNKGFTLIELLVGVALIGFITLLAYTFYLNTFQFQLIQERRKDMQIRMLLSMDMLTRDIQAAGFGVIDPRIDGNKDKPCDGVLAMPLAICDTTKPRTNVAVVAVNGPVEDRITLVGRDQFVGTLAVPTVKLGKTITVINPVVVVNNLVTIGGFFSSMVTSVHANVITLGTGLGEREVYPMGTDVYTVSTIEYSIAKNPDNNNEPALFRQVGVLAADNPPVLIADGIEDLQVAYYLSGKQPFAGITPVDAVNIPINGAAFTAVRVSLVARVADPSPNYKGGQPITSEGHVSGAVGDRFRRAAVTRVVELPNDGCDLRDAIC